MRHDLAASLEEHNLVLEGKDIVLVKGPLSGFNKNKVDSDIPDDKK